MATDALHTNSSAWPQVGNPPPNAISPTDPNPEWEMVADNDISSANTATNKNSSTTKEVDNDHVLILPDNIHSSMQSNTKVKGRPRSATIGGERLSSSPNKSSSLFHRAHTTTAAADSTTDNNSDMSSRTKRRTLRRFASTPDLFVSDNAHEVIVEDESDEEESSCDEDLNDELGDSFEVVSNHDEEDDNDEQSQDADPDDDNSGAQDDNDEPLFNLIEGEDESEFQRSDEESATLVSTPSMDTSTAWTMASAIPSTTGPSSTTATGGTMWGMKKSPSFAEMLAKNINSDNNTNFNGAGWGSDKTKTEAMLRDSHRKHHLRVKTKPKFIVTEDTGGKTMKHAHSTGDLSQMLVGAERERARMFGQAGRKRMSKKQFSDIMEEDDDAADFVIGRGSGSGGGGGGGCDGDVLGETDAMDFYHRKDKGSKGTSNKKKLRPDEAKRRDIIMHKKEMQRKKQAESQKAAGSGAVEKSTKSGKKKKNEKGVGGKKERRRL